MILILVEASYADSIWCIRLLEGLTGRLKQKRLPFRQITSLDEAGPDSRYIYLIGSDNVWLEAALQACNQAGVYPILLCNQAYHTFDADYSTVCLDAVISMRRLLEILTARRLDRVAPVSYTHLDVYKRQARRQAGFLRFCRALGRCGGLRYRPPAPPPCRAQNGAPARDGCFARR